MVNELSSNLWNADRNIIADYFFINFELAEEQLINQTTYGGTVRKNKRHSRIVNC